MRSDLRATPVRKCPLLVFGVLSGPNTAADATRIGAASKAERVHALDGLRGVAAIVVLLFHEFCYVEMPPELHSLVQMTPLGPFVNGPGAVHVFFVLSGYVLAMSLQGDTSRGWLGRYLVRRVFRIQPPYMAAVLLAWVVARYAVPPGPHLPHAPWVRLPAAALPLALGFPSMAFGLLPVGWSLFVEMAISGLFPLLFAIGRRVHPCIPIALSALFLYSFDGRFPWLLFLLDFALGLALQLEAARIARFVRRLPARAPALLGVAGLVLFQVPNFLGLRNTGYAGLEFGNTPAVVAQFATASALVVIAALHAPWLHAVLSSRPARYFGRISYSFYLVHFTILLAFVMRAKDHVLSWPSWIGVIAVIFALTVALGELGWRFVELPAIRAGRGLVRAGATLVERVAIR